MRFIKSMMNKILRLDSYISFFRIIKILWFSLYGRILNSELRKKDIWLIAERRDEARDNGFFLFKFIRENYPEINVYYVIDRNSSDYNKVTELGNVIEYRSSMHFLYYCFTTKLISTHIYGSAPDTKIAKYIRKFLIVPQKFIFLQHGIIKDYLPNLTYGKALFDLFVCGARPEYDYVKKEFGYSDNQVKYLGLARFDNLHNIKPEKIILLMPTFRKWLNNTGSIEDVHTKFRASQYFKQYNSLLSSSTLHKILKVYDLKLIFYPHYEMQKYINLFKENENVVIARKDKYDVQDLLIRSSILVTDYSSVYFDFAYMDKPVIYYHFDYEKYRGVHYAEGYFSYENNGFGPICNEEEELLKMLEYYVKNNFIIDKKYASRISSFYELKDCSNAKRNFEAIQDL